MPTITFRKRQRFADIASDTLTECIVPPLLVGCLPSLFAHTPMSFFGKLRLIRLPKVTIPATLTKRGRDAMPQTSAGAVPLVAKDKSQNGTSASQQDRPEPPFVDPFSDKAPRFIDFQDVIRLWGRERLLQRRQRLDFFLIQAARVFREMPKIRLIPLILGRSK